MFEYIYNEEHKPWKRKRPRQIDESDVGNPPQAPVQTYDIEQMPSDERKVQWDSEGELILWPIPPNPPAPILASRASVVNISKAPRYRIARAAMLLDDPNVEAIIYAAGVITAWDNDGDIQIPQNEIPFSADDESDNGVEYITIPTVAYDNDADYQKDYSWSFTFDSQEEREGTNFIILPFNDWTSPFEGQLDRSWRIGDDVADAGIEIIVPPIPLFVLGGGFVVLLTNTSGSAGPAITADGEITLAVQTAGSAIPAIGATGEVELAINVNAGVINSGEK